ncbi:hypothetical protein [Alkaliphilus hydrothermalis]|uniref:PH domain-containing protein n=1 Tax=Alkaliphilus hydrothermalis TaxID=1482730 RepID=A0ABS2NP62_9FIRM|nr:hypothetical protein [Alkaliphilus hydrothermalis]MBM7614733.1 hypothetical protein [Alkaliphilus hydrothermalis]
MAALIRQTVSEPQKPLWKNILYVLAVVLGINLAVELTNFLPKAIAGIVSVIILIFSAVFISYLLNRKLAQYTYILIEDELIFYKQLGKRENKVLNVKIYDLDWIKSMDQLAKKEKVKKIYSLACRLKGEDVFVGQFKEDEKVYRFIFQPNDGLLKAINRQIKPHKNL